MAEPAAEIDIDVDLIRRLLEAQHPDLAERRITIAANGWDNVIARLGDDLAVRLPRRLLAARLIEHEQRWLPTYATLLDVPIPVAVRHGRPGEGYPWSWSIVPWFDGREIADAVVADRGRVAAPLARALRGLHVPADPDAPDNPFRAVALGTRDAVVRGRIGRHEPAVASALLGAWDAGVAAPVWSGVPVWVQGDLHLRNVLVDDVGDLAALIDFGDLTAGDPAVDLQVAWSLFDDAGRAAFIDAYGVGADDPLWTRAAAWAVVTASIVTPGDDPAFDDALAHIAAAVGR